ncbi:MAG: hypothetical protein V7L25_03075, partial [Nostoc sp.]|uniref:hypothetical protein n=1 Tax=Nostoc sp. TaxID=1180 RepID=UPI002FF30B53
ITVGSSHLNLSRNSRNTYSLCPNVIGYGYIKDSFTSIKDSLTEFKDSSKLNYSLPRVLFTKATLYIICLGTAANSVNR